MDRGLQASRALRWCVVPVDDSLLAIKYVDNEIAGYTLTVDAAERTVRSGAKCYIEVPSLPERAELVAATRVEDRLMAVPVTLLIFRCSVQVDAPSQRPSKRARRASLSQSSQLSDEPTTRLLFYASFKDATSDTGWFVQPLGDAAVAGEADALQVHVLDGPAAVVFNSSTSELTLLQTKTTDEGDYAFAVSRAALKLPGADTTELLSCQFVGEEITPTPHILLKYRLELADENDGSQSSALASNWQSTAERQLWATLSLSDAESAIAPCEYLPLRWMRDEASEMDEFITACAFAAPMGTSSFHDVHPVASSSQLTRVHPSVTIVVGTSASTIHIVANEISLATYVVAGSPRHIELAFSDESSAFEVGVRCADVDRSFHFLSINTSNQRQRLITPLQHFTFVGQGFRIPQDLTSPHANRIVLLNDVDPVAEVDFLQFSLRKSVLVDIVFSNGNDAKAPCHRLKYRTDDKVTKRRRGGKSTDNGEGEFQCIERVKLDRREPDCDDHSTNNTSSASEQQLLQLTKSLEERLRIGHERSQRLERVVSEKMKMVHHLNRLLQATVGPIDEPSSSDDTILPLDLAPIVDLDTSRQPSIDADSQTIQFTPVATFPTQHLEKLSIRSFDPSTSILLVVLDARVSSNADDPDGHRKKTFSVVALERSPSTKPLRSWSRVVSISPLAQIDERQQSRVRLELAIDIPAGHLRLKNEPFQLGLWLRTETIDDAASNALVSSEYVGDLNVDLVSLLEKLQLSREAFASGPVDPTSTREGKSAVGSSLFLQLPNRVLNMTRREDQLLLVSGGSSVRENISEAVLHSALLQPTLARPLFAVLTSTPTWAGSGPALENYAMAKLLRTLPADVIPMVNPLASSSLDKVQGLLSLLESEMDSLLALENADSSETAKAGQHLVDLMATQGETDRQAVRLLNELQRRINFHSMWELSKE